MKIDQVVFLFSVCLLMFVIMMIAVFSCTSSQQKVTTRVEAVAPVISTPAALPQCRPPLTDTPNAINSSTRGQYAYQQIGILYREVPDGESKVLPLYGRPTCIRSQRWNYYTQTDGFNPIKLSIQMQHKDCMDQVGCNEINDGDEINVPELNAVFRVRIYQTAVPTYIPNVV